MVPRDIMLCVARNLLNLSSQDFIRAVEVVEDMEAMTRMSIYTTGTDAAIWIPHCPDGLNLAPRARRM